MTEARDHHMCVCVLLWHNRTHFSGGLHQKSLASLQSSIHNSNPWRPFMAQYTTFRENAPNCKQLLPYFSRRKKHQHTRHSCSKSRSELYMNRRKVCGSQNTALTKNWDAQTGMVIPVSSPTFVPRARGRCKNHVHFNLFPSPNLSFCIISIQTIYLFYRQHVSLVRVLIFFFLATNLLYTGISYSDLANHRVFAGNHHSSKFSCGLVVLWPETFLFCPLYMFIHFSASFCMAHCALDFASCHRNIHYYFKYSTWTHF